MWGGVRPDGRPSTKIGISIKKFYTRVEFLWEATNLITGQYSQPGFHGRENLVRPLIFPLLSAQTSSEAKHLGWISRSSQVSSIIPSTLRALATNSLQKKARSPLLGLTECDSTGSINVRPNVDLNMRCLPTTKKTTPVLMPHFNDRHKGNFRTLWHDVLVPLVSLLGVVWFAALVTSWCLLVHP